MLSICFVNRKQNRDAIPLENTVKKIQKRSSHYLFCWCVNPFCLSIKERVWILHLLNKQHILLDNENNTIYSIFPQISSFHFLPVNQRVNPELIVVSDQWGKYSVQFQRKYFQSKRHKKEYFNIYNVLIFCWNFRMTNRDLLHICQSESYSLLNALSGSNSPRWNVEK